MKEVIVIVTPDGQSRIETQGFQGAECQQASEFLKRALGVAGQEQLKPEYFRQANQENIATETR